MGIHKLRWTISALLAAAAARVGPGGQELRLPIAGRDQGLQHIIASRKLTPDEVGTVRAYLLALDSTDEGRKKLEPTKYTGFAAYDTAAMLAIGTWLGL